MHKENIFGPLTCLEAYNFINKSITAVNTHLYNYIERCQSHKPTLTHTDMAVIVIHCQNWRQSRNFTSLFQRESCSQIV